MLIRIRNTTFGLVVNGIVKPKSPKDPPFDVDEKLGLRLVREGIAEAVDGTERGEVQSESNDNDNNESAGDDFGIPQYSADTSKADLQSIANEYGIDLADWWPVMMITYGTAFVKSKSMKDCLPNSVRTPNSGRNS